MGILQDIAASIGNQDLQRLSDGDANFDNTNSPDIGRLQQMIKNIDPEKLQQIFASTAAETDPQEYSDHVTPGAGGTNPLGGLSAAALGSLATILVSHLRNAGASRGASGSPIDQVPDLQTKDPKQMDADDVAAVATYTQQNHPEVFGQAATQVAQQQPALLHSFLGKAALAIGAAALASHYIKMDKRAAK
ncbi:MAG TPA: hypothetical protein VGM76_13950 [Lacipirellulaceae bacterium]|jgi:hypothetical protein